MHKAYEYRLYPIRSQYGMLLSALTESRHIYNEMLELVISHYDETGEFLGRYDLMHRFKGRGGEHVPQTTAQALANRLNKAFKLFFRRRKIGCWAGFPRFKSANRWHSIQLRQYGAGRDVFLNHKSKRLHVPKKLGSRIKVKIHRPLEGTPKTAHLVCRADGHWYVLIVCDLGEAPDKRDGDAVGLDVGLKHFVADSDGSTVANRATSGNPRRNSAGRSARCVVGRKAPTVARMRHVKRRSDISRSSASAKITPTKSQEDTLTDTLSSPSKTSEYPICSRTGISPKLSPTRVGPHSKTSSASKRKNLVAE